MIALDYGYNSTFSKTRQHVRIEAENVVKSEILQENCTNGGVKDEEIRLSAYKSK